MRVSFLATAVFAAVASAVPQQNVKRPDPNADTAPNLGYTKLLELQKHFYDRFTFPNNVVEAESINSTIFAEDVQGRVSDTRNFEGRELNTEYIFGLFTPSERVSIIGIPLSYEIIQFTANQNIASATTRLQFQFPKFNNMTLPVTVDTWLTWNQQGEITQYDVTFRWFANLLNTLITALDPTNQTNAVKIATQSIANSICASHEDYCRGSGSGTAPGYPQYEDKADCMKFLTETIRVGQSFELGMNTLMCRSLHMHMLKYRPEVHCAHIGKTGGGMCVDDLTYAQKVEEDYFKNSPWIPIIY